MRWAGLIILLAGCGDVEVSGQVSFIETSVKQVDGQFYVRMHANGITVDCMAVDPSTLYPSEWVEIEEADAARLAAYTAAELANCE